MEAYSPNNKRIFSRLGKRLEGGQVSLGKKFFSCYRGHSVSNVSRRGGKNHANFKGYLSHRKNRAFFIDVLYLEFSGRIRDRYKSLVGLAYTSISIDEFAANMAFERQEAIEYAVQQQGTSMI